MGKTEAVAEAPAVEPVKEKKAAAPVLKVDGPEYRSVLLEDLQLSPTNPRKHCDEAALAEFAENVKAVGICEPLLVRPHPLRDMMKLPGHGDKNRQPFEIIAGSRRFKAAKLAGLKDVPVRVMALTDNQALEIQIIENLQREDVHPLDEAEGYQVLIEKTGQKVEEIAKKVGKSPSHIYMTMVLTKLVEEVRAPFVAGKLTKGHAEKIARLTPADQKRALEHCLKVESWRDEKDGDEFYRLESTRSLQEWINDNIHCDLKAAKFDKEDATLVPAAGACSICPKRTGNCPDLFTDVKKADTCTDPKCFKKKCDAFIKRQEEKVKAELDATEKVVRLSEDYRKAGAIGCYDYEKVKPGTKGAVTGIMVDGKSQGKVVAVKLKQKPVSERKSEEELKAEREALTEKVNFEKDRRTRIFKAILQAVKGAATRRILNRIADCMDFPDEFLDVLGVKDRRKFNVEKLTDEQLHRLFVASELDHDLGVRDWNVNEQPKKLLEFAKAYKVDVAAIDKKLKADIAGAKPEPEPEPEQPKEAPYKPVLVVRHTESGEIRKRGPACRGKEWEKGWLDQNGEYLVGEPAKKKTPAKSKSKPKPKSKKKK